MIATTDSIATTPDHCDYHPNRGILHRQAIATESQDTADPAWREALDCLEEVWKDPSRFGDGLVVPPSRSAIDAAFEWLTELRAALPDSPPTLITVEPAGGIIIERSESLGGDEVVSELTFYNAGSAEHTLYRNGRAIRIVPIQYRARRA